MHRSKIEWVLNPDNKTLGWCWNPLTGCLNHTPDGLCLGGMFPCYAFKLANGRLKQRYLANINVAPRKLITRILPRYDPFYPRFWWNRLRELVLFGGYKPKGIFVCDMGELFGDWIPEEWQREIFAAIKCYPQHRFYLLTKQPQNLPQFSPFPDNCYIGVTATSNAMFQGACHWLRLINAKIKFVSLEPLLDWDMKASEWMTAQLFFGDIDWLILGAQTKPYKPPKLEWVREIVEACDKARVKVFLKDNLGPLIDENCPDESDLQPNHDSLFRMKHPFLCEGCDGEDCHKCGVIWGLRQEMPDANS